MRDNVSGADQFSVETVLLEKRVDCLFYDWVVHPEASSTARLILRTTQLEPQVPRNGLAAIAISTGLFDTPIAKDVPGKGRDVIDPEPLDDVTRFDFAR